MKHLQQGDVLLHPTKIPISKYEKIDSPVIQEGEHTGHAHRIVMFRHEDFGPTGGENTKVTHNPDWELLKDVASGNRFLRVGPGGIEISHEEHKTIAVPPGEYRIGIVREYDHFAEEARSVQD